MSDTSKKNIKKADNVNRVLFERQRVYSTDQVQISCLNIISLNVNLSFMFDCKDQGYKYHEIKAEIHFWKGSWREDLYEPK